MTDRAVHPDVDRHLARFARRLRNDTSFMSGVLAVYQMQEHLSDEALAEQLQITPPMLSRLALCRRPQADRFAEQVRQIAAYIGVNAAALAQMIRQVEALQQLSTMPPIADSATEPRAASAPMSGLLAAARDHEEPADESEAEDQAAENDTTEL